MDLAELRENINKLGTDMAAIMSKAKDEKRELTADEEKRFDAMDADREKAVATERRMKRVEELEGSRGRQTDPVQPTQQPRHGSSSEFRAEDLERERRDHGLMLQAFFDQRQRPEYVEAAKRLGIPASFGNQNCVIVLPQISLRSKRQEDLAAWEKQFSRPTLYAVSDIRSQTIRQLERRDLTSGVFSPDNTGHFGLQPSEMLRSLEVALLAYGGMRENSTVTRSDTGVPLPFPSMNDTANKGAIIGETTQETSDVDPPFAQPVVLHAYTYSSKKVPVSIEFMQDNAINFEARIGEILGTRIARITNDHFTTGTGSGQPTGIVASATSSGLTAASATTFVYDDLVGLEHSIDPAYRQRGPQGAKFMFTDATLLAIKKIKVPHFSGDTQGWPLWRPGLTVSEPDTIDGYQYVINQSMPAPTTGQKAMLFGLLSKYQIRDVRMVEIVRLNELRAEYREVEWFAFYRGDGKLLDAGTHPVKYITMA